MSFEFLLGHVFDKPFKTYQEDINALLKMVVRLLALYEETIGSLRAVPYRTRVADENKLFLSSQCVEKGLGDDLSKEE
jgi:hypothetical protein